MRARVASLHPPSRLMPHFPPPRLWISSSSRPVFAFARTRTRACGYACTCVYVCVRVSVVWGRGECTSSPSFLLFPHVSVCVPHVSVREPFWGHVGGQVGDGAVRVNAGAADGRDGLDEERAPRPPAARNPAQHRHRAHLLREQRPPVRGLCPHPWATSGPWHLRRKQDLHYGICRGFVRFESDRHRTDRVLNFVGLDPVWELR